MCGCFMAALFAFLHLYIGKYDLVTCVSASGLQSSAAIFSFKSCAKLMETCYCGALGDGAHERNTQYRHWGSYMRL